MAKDKKKKSKVIIFSGVRQLAGLAQYPYVAEVINGLRGSTFITGGAPGIDTIACVEAVRAFPKARHICVVPWKYALNDVHFAWCEQQGVEVLDMPEPPNRRQAPAIFRNEYMIALGQKIAEEQKIEAILVAFPGGRIEQQRSGTWTTIRRARAADMRIFLHPLSEANGTSIGGQIEE